jgi:hypothetical protein
MLEVSLINSVKAQWSLGNAAIRHHNGSFKHLAEDWRILEPPTRDGEQAILDLNKTNNSTFRSNKINGLTSKTTSLS